MPKRIIKIMFFGLLLFSVYNTQNQQRPRQGGARPPRDNDRGLRTLTEEEIPPNLNFYTMDPLYNPDAILGWADDRVQEKLDRGLVAIPLADGNLSFRPVSSVRIESNNPP